METEEGFVYTIKGTKVIFPCKAYPTQLSMMDKIIRSLSQQQNSLLESPTGSGKSLALLCSCLAWQKAEYDKQAKAQAKKEQADCKELCHIKPEGLEAEPFVNDNSRAVAQDQENDQVMCENTQDASVYKQETDSSVKNEILQEHSYASIPSEDDSQGDFQAPKKRFRTPGQPSSCAKKQRIESVDEIEITSPPKWTMELNVPNPQSCCSSGEHSPEFVKKISDCDTEMEDICVPKIYFGTRTHKQIAQISRELGKTAYKHTRMCILSSREHSCIHPRVSKGKNKNEECKKLLDGSTGETCVYYQKSFSLSRQKGIKSQGLDAAWDIEDLVALGKRLKSCPYFASRELMREADIVFCPYNYLIDPKIRSQMEIDLAGQIVVLDEGHNIEDSARDAASFTLTAIQLTDAMHDLDKMVSLGAEPEKHRALHVMLANILRWMDVNSSSLKETSFEKSSKVWSGKEILTVLEEIGLTTPMLDLFKKNFRDLMALQNDPSRTPGTPKMVSNTVSLLEGLILVLCYVLGCNHKHVTDYRVALLKTAVIVHDFMPGGWQRARSSRKEWTQSLNFWCLNPAVVFSEIACQVRSLVLTSGTLSPMNSFSSELGMEFPIKLEANHVVGRSQVWVGSVGAGPSGAAINACYKSSETFNFQDEVGNLLLEVCKVIPHGVLCFFPSYKMLEKLSQRWQSTRLWSELEKRKVIVSEPRSGDKEEFDEIMQQFYQAIENSESNQDSDCEDELLTGGLFLAVCRGKVSEGLDFADNNARAVVTVGIPFPNVKDTQVDLKRKYNNQYSSSRGLLSGNEWYEIQAFRALNQALGRCIRHKQDWGAIILVDERFNKSPRYLNGLSKWVRQRCQSYRSFNSAITSLDEFARARLIDPCPKHENSFLSSQAGGGLSNLTKEQLVTSVCNSPTVPNNSLARTPNSQSKVTIFPDNFNAFCNGFVTSPTTQQQLQPTESVTISKITNRDSVDEKQATYPNVLPSLILQAGDPSSFSPAVTPVKTVVKPTPSKSTVSWFKDESISDHINFSSTSTPLFKNDKRKNVVPENSHPGSKQPTGRNSNDSCNSERVSCSDSRCLTDGVSGFSIVTRNVPMENFRLLDPKESLEVSSCARESTNTENTVDDFPDSPDLFSASPLPCDVRDESERKQSAEDEFCAFTPQSKILSLSKTMDTKLNSNNKDKILFDNITKSELNDQPTSINSTTLRNLFRKQKEHLSTELEKTSGNVNCELAQHDSCLKGKENLSPVEQDQQNANVSEIMCDSKHHGKKAISEAEVTSGNLGKEQLNDAVKSSLTTEVVDKQPSPQKTVSRSNIRQARRKSSRLSSRKVGSKVSECKTTNEKAKNCRSDTANQDQEEFHGQLKCSSCGAVLVKGHYKKQKSESRFLSEIRQLYNRKPSSSQLPVHSDVMVHRDNVTSNLKPLLAENDSSNVNGLKLNSYFDPESKCCFVPQACKGCLQKDSPATTAVIGVQVFPVCLSSVCGSSADDLKKSWVWLLHEAVLQPRTRK